MQFFNRSIIHTAYLIFLVVLSYLLFANTIDLNLINHYQQPLFLFDLNSLYLSFAEPGGFIEYIGGFITELYSFKILGNISLIILLSILPCMVYRELKKAIPQFYALVYSSLLYLVSVLLVINYFFEINNYLTIIGAFFFSKLLFFISNKVNQKPLMFTLLVAVLFVSYLTVGGFGQIIAVLLSVIFIIFKAEKTSFTIPITSSVIIIAVSILLPLILIKTIYQLTTIKIGYLGSFTEIDTISSKVFYSIFIALLIAVVFVKRIKLSKPENKILQFSVLVFLLIGIYIVPSFLIDEIKQKNIKLNYQAYMGDWKSLLQDVDKDLLDNMLAVNQVNRALFANGGLLNTGFSVPQKFGSNALFLSMHMNQPVLVATSDIYFDLGFINESRHWAHEAYTRLGKQPRILKRLVEVNIINEKYNTAQKYIYILKKSMVNRSWAIEKEKLLKNKEALQNDSSILFKRSLMPNVDFFARRNEPINDIKELVVQSNNNRMALEYLVFKHMLDHEIVHVLKLVPKFAEYKYKELPELVQEAIILYMVKTNKQQLNLLGYRFNPEKIKEFRNYSGLYQAFKQGDKSAKSTLDEKYSDSYWYYLHFISPLSKK